MLDAMKVFISSVRVGLEQERDALPGLIRAIGHDPLRFEDFTALSMPSREACLRGVDAADVYLMLLGPHYGHVFPETGQSATHDEWMAALSKGMPRIVFRKVGVPFDHEQEEFIKQIGDYGTGVFYRTFETAVDLQAKVVEALRAIASTPSDLTYEPLISPPPISWRSDWEGYSPNAQREAALIVHVAPLGVPRLSARLMSELEPRLVAALRRVNAVPPAAGLTPSRSANAVNVALTQPSRRGHHEIQAGALSHVRATSAGEVALSWSLPGDGLGVILDPDDLVATTAQSLRLIGATGLINANRVTAGIELADVMLASEGKLTGAPRSSASFGFSSQQDVHVEPDESVSSSALDRGADEVAATLVRTLLAEFRRRR
jgi:hypothetical protein